MAASSSPCTVLAFPFIQIEQPRSVSLISYQRTGRKEVIADGEGTEVDGLLEFGGGGGSDSRQGDRD
jgi:hypothetical protein